MTLVIWVGGVLGSVLVVSCFLGMLWRWITVAFQFGYLIGGW